MLNRTLATPPRRTSVVKPFEAALDHYTHYLSKQDTGRFERQLENYRLGELPLSEIRKTVQIWAVRYDKMFTRQDAVFRPYPGPLAGA